MILIKKSTVIKAATASDLHFEQHFKNSGEDEKIIIDCDRCRLAYDRAHFAVYAAVADMIEEVQ